MPPSSTRTTESARGLRTAHYVLLATATTTLAIVLRSGYTFGLFDQTVYAVHGIALADPTAYANDWFARSVPQPHWLFDALTYVGARFNVLPLVYFVYWLAGIAVFAVGSVWLVDRFLPGRRSLSLALGPLVALGPAGVLGSTTPLLWFADPHMLGGCLAFLALAGTVTGRWRWAAVAALGAMAVHVQHGANLAPIFLLAAVLGKAEPPRHRWLLAGTAAGLLATAPLIAVWRGIETGGDEWLTICRDIIPFHCYAPIWPAGILAGGAAVVALALALAWWQRSHWRTVLPAVALPAIGLALAVTAERFELGIFGRLAAQYNVHRLATLVLPMAALAVLGLAAHVMARLGPGDGARTSEGRARALPSSAMALGAVGAWMALEAGALHRDLSASVLVAVALTGVLLWFTLPREDGRILRPSRATGFRRSIIANLAVTTTLVAVAVPSGALGRLDYDRRVARVRTGQDLRRLLPPDAVIAAPPETIWLRSLSRRSVIADCKAVPYGGAPWHEYMARMTALGGLCHGTESDFDNLSPAAVEALQRRYGATHVLLFDNDPKMAHATTHWRQIYNTPAPPDGSAPQGLTVFELPLLRHETLSGATHS